MFLIWQVDSQRPCKTRRWTPAVLCWAGWMCFVIRLRWKLQRVCRPAVLYSELSSCHLRCTPAMSNLYRSLLLSEDSCLEEPHRMWTILINQTQNKSFSNLTHPLLYLTTLSHTLVVKLKLEWCTSQMLHIQHLLTENKELRVTNMIT